ncbi:MAG TPA: Rieske 2Fe-2S domain-containing protein [Acidimicrobiales bacterium]|nr:Rieske 2Fe-2S domain-containing protein [Acidimicrobiales bacterium]
MDNSTIFLLAVVGLLGLMFVFLFATARRRDAQRALEQAPAVTADDGASPVHLPVPVGHVSASGRELERTVALERRGAQIAPPADAPPPALPAPPDEEALGVTRRQVLNRGIVTTMALTVGGFGAACVGMLWPILSGGFGSKIRVGKFDDIMQQINDKKEPFYLASGRLYINPYPPEDATKAKKIVAYSAVLPGYQAGVVALYQKCVHLGCRVPWCKTSQWFECPCHGSQYNRVGEKKGGPAPRGLDRFVATVDGGIINVDTKTVIPGPPIGTNTTGQEAEGPHCIGQASEK